MQHQLDDMCTAMIIIEALIITDLREQQATVLLSDTWSVSGTPAASGGTCGQGG